VISFYVSVLISTLRAFSDRPRGAFLCHNTAIPNRPNCEGGVNLMKWSLYSFVLILACVSLSACSATANPTPTTTASPIPSPSATATPAATVEPTVTPTPALPIIPIIQPAPCDASEAWQGNRSVVKNDYYPEKPLDCEFYAPLELTKVAGWVEEVEQRGIYQSYDDELALELQGLNPLDPVDIALLFAGFPNSDNISPDKVMFFYKNGIEVTVVIMHYGIKDDSTADRETRVDLRREVDAWAVEWMGYRQRCYRSHNPDWVKSPCP
jgi:hypothetical protein